jgi:hypothetical protein
MDEPTKRRGRWWQQNADRTWLRWNEQTQVWEPQGFPPPPPDDDLASADAQTHPTFPSQSPTPIEEASHATTEVVHGPARLEAIAESTFDIQTQMYVRKELDGLKSAIHEGEQPLRLAMAREHRSRMAGLALVTTAGSCSQVTECRMTRSAWMSQR